MASSAQDPGEPVVESKPAPLMGRGGWVRRLALAAAILAALAWWLLAQRPGLAPGISADLFTGPPAASLPPPGAPSPRQRRGAGHGRPLAAAAPLPGQPLAGGWSLAQHQPRLDRTLIQSEPDIERPMGEPHLMPAKPAAPPPDLPRIAQTQVQAAREDSSRTGPASALAQASPTAVASASATARTEPEIPLTPAPALRKRRTMIPVPGAESRGVSEVRATPTYRAEPTSSWTTEGAVAAPLIDTNPDEAIPLTDDDGDGYLQPAPRSRLRAQERNRVRSSRSAPTP